jgi:hypothetical protein
MSQTNRDAIAQVFTDFCLKKKYQYAASNKESNVLRLDISNLAEKTIVNIYDTGTVQVQGKQNTLKAEFERLKAELEENPGAFIKSEAAEVQACAQKYDIMLPTLRTKVKHSWNSVIGVTVEINDNPTAVTEYRARITRNKLSLTATQYSNGSLLLQGKTDALFNQCCDLVEEVAIPSEKDVIARFISCDEKSLELFTTKYTSELLEVATTKVKEIFGDVYDFIEPHDQKWFIASKCLCMAQVPLPEFSPLVMPASKAFEGFAKKLVVSIGLFDKDHFKPKGATFSYLNDRTHTRRKAICDKEKHADTYLSRLNVDLDTYRNFMMHSDESKITKINTQEEAEEKLRTIFKETKEIFDYFRDLIL